MAYRTDNPMDGRGVPAAGHTPGPWFWFAPASDSDPMLRIASEGQPSHASVHGDTPALHRALRANAALIAAAPDLLAALRGLVQWCEGRALYSEELHTAKAALARAEDR